MSKKVSGVVRKVWIKQFDGKNGKPGNKWYSITLEGDDRYYRCKGTNPGDVDGKTIEFEVDKVTDKDAEVITSSIKVIEPRKSAGVAATASVTGGALPPTARDTSIHYQSARKDALQFVDIATKLTAIKLPAKEASRLQELEALVDHYTATYFEDISTQGAVARANGTDTPAEEAPTDTSGEEE